MNIKWNRLFQIIEPLLIYYVVYNGIAILCEILLHDRFSQLFYLLIASIITIIPIYYIYSKINILRPEKYFAKEDAVRDLLFIAAIIGTGIVLNLIVSYFSLTDSVESYNNAKDILYSGKLITKICANAFFIPILEELLFRGIILGQLNIFYKNKLIGIIISSVLFGIMHFNVVQFLYAFILGGLLGAVYTKTNKIWLTITAHAVLNLIIIIFTI